MPLLDIIKQRIADDGPISVETYMNLCLGHETHGYYMGRDPFGRGGDFITAPEVSQMFGEALGLWLATAWQMIGRPKKVNLVEPGPGRGTLMSDMLRAARVLPEFLEAIDVHLIEMSPVLRKMQAETLKGLEVNVNWHQRIEQVPKGPMLFAANEFFDALPPRQFIRVGNDWHERLIGLGDHDALTWTHAPAPLAASEVPPWAREAEEGAIFETSPARDAVAEHVGHVLARDGGAGLVVDYGHALPFAKDTFQAVQKHKFTDPLARPGEADLTSHVDFAALADAFRRGGAETHGPRTQRAFLIAMGLNERLAALKKKAPARTRIMLSKQADRLVGEKQMGNLFKVLAVTQPGLNTPHPFAEPAP